MSYLRVRKKETMTPYPPEAFQQYMSEANAIVLDTREAVVFVQGFIPGSIFIGISSPRFGEWASLLLPRTSPWLLVCEPGTEAQAAAALQRAGLPAPAGYLEGGFNSWVNSGKGIDMIVDVEADELAMDIPFDENLLVLDVRNETEFADGHVKDAMHLPLEEFTDIANIAMLDEGQTIYVHCKSGYRSVIAAALLKREGLHNLRNVTGGWDAIVQESRIETEKDKGALN
jgi:rhodanese-related sulfurtransferase